jgi:hypothetical protein
VTSGLNEFQGNLEFTNAVHWDVGYSGEARYFIYRDDDGNLLAWYDRIKKCGFKPNFENLIGAGDLIAQV